MRVELTVPDEQYQQVNTIAQHRKQDVQDMLQEMLLDAIFSLRDEEPLLFATEFQWFQDSHAEFLKLYPNEWIAIIGHDIVDHDQNRMALERRLVTAYDDAPVFVDQVTPTLKTDIFVRSPRFE